MAASEKVFFYGGETSRNLFNYIEKEQGVVVRTLPRASDSGLGGGVGGQQHNFKFDEVFEPHCSQHAVFDEVSEMVQSAFDRYHVRIFAYGQLGSGKTNAMLGKLQDEDRRLGMIPRAARHVF